MERKWLPTFAELIDRLSIHQLKEIFISEHKDKYAKEMEDICNDLQVIISEKDIKITGELIRSIVIISQINAHIWYNETKARQGIDQDLSLLKLTHGINGLRSEIQNYILELIGEVERKDWKIDCLASEFKNWEISLFKKKKDES